MEAVKISLLIVQTIGWLVVLGLLISVLPLLKRNPDLNEHAKHLDDGKHNSNPSQSRKDD